MTRSSTSPPRPTSTARSSARPTSAGRSSSAPRCCSRRCAAPASRFVQVSTDEVYGDLGGGGSAAETDPVKPSSPYSVAKAAGDLHIPAYARTFGVNASITRGSNTYGPNQYPEKLIPLMTTNAIEGQPLPVYGDGKQIRDWLWVEDHCAGIELVLREGAPGEVYNVGGDDERENVEIVGHILRLTGADESLIRHVEDRAGPRPPLLARHEQAARARLGAAEGVRGGDLRDGRLVPRQPRAGGSRSSPASTATYYEKQYAARLAAS